ncbi:MAG: hypothetical protein P8Q36_09425 [Alphaproteobacteria bacterium]|nr:hypothetical protein [Alphaproteobacteria bacterium]
MRMLAYVEDPGAANWFVPMIAAMSGDDIILLAAGAAVGYLRDRGLEVLDVSEETQAGDLLSRHAPGLVVSGTSENLESPGLALIDAARDAGIPSAAPVDQAANAQHRFRGTSDNPLRHAPDLVMVADDRAATAFAELGFAGSAVAVTGNPHHDWVLSAAAGFEGQGREALRKAALPEAGTRPVIIFLAEVGYAVNPEADRWNATLNFEGRDGTAPRCARMLEELLDAMAQHSPRPWIVLRLHPKNTRDEFAAYLDEIDQVSEGGDPLALVWAADLMVGMSGSLLEEAHLMGRPCLSILPYAVERDWLPGIGSGAIPAVEHRSGLHARLNGPWQATPVSHRAGGAGAAMAEALHRLVAHHHGAGRQTA